MKQVFFKFKIKSFFSWLKEWEVAVILILNSLVFFLILYNDIHKSTEFGNREIIGDINFKYNNVKRKFEHNVVWSEMDLNSIISFRDSVLTENNSNAIIKLKDGTEIHLEPESMIILDISDNNKKIGFNNGSINVIKKPTSEGGNDSITVETESGNIQFDNADVVISKVGDQNLNVGVARGDAKASVGGKKFNLKENESLEFKGEFSTKTNKKITIINPVQLARQQEEAIQKKFFNKMDAIAQKELELESSNQTQDAQSTSSSNSSSPNKITSNNNNQNGQLKPKKKVDLKTGRYDALDGF